MIVPRWYVIKNGDQVCECDGWRQRAVLSAVSRASLFFIPKLSVLLTRGLVTAFVVLVYLIFATISNMVT